MIENPDAELVPPCEAAKPPIIVYGKRVGTTVTVCTDNQCPVHDPRPAAAQAASEADKFSAGCSNCIPVYPTELSDALMIRIQAS